MTSLTKAKRPEKPGSLERRSDAPTTLTLELKVVTFIQGGGISWSEDDLTKHVKHIDPVTPIRGSAIRGHLRFWWRATHGCKAESIKAMRERESKLWGSSSQAGLVSLKVQGKPGVSEVALYKNVAAKTSGKFNPKPAAGHETIAYAGIGVQPKGGQTQQPSDGVVTKVDGAVSLTLSFDALTTKEERTQVLDALQAWRLFGGLGGRTRRGYGTIAIGETTDFRHKAPTEFLEGFTSKNTLRLVPSLHNASCRLNPKATTAERAWKAAIGALQSFRQGPGVGRNPGQSRPGRSRWPEPDEVRRLTGTNDQQHKPEHVVRKFPRARFGMPIIFHFQSRDDPKDTTLKPANYERMASPLIVKAVATSDGYCPLALVLTVPGADDVALVLNANPRDHKVNASLTDDEARNIKPMEQLGSDPLAAFLNFFSQGTR